MSLITSLKIKSLAKALTLKEKAIITIRANIIIIYYN